ncbi:hypothetical protein [uncultured Winogradskyella sp.]|uniref:hypothetical protein n=1 Tax=uncultured Winogradskyella sp. TaxID=395353 RepID=UPI00263133E2|nr:hypothetical protein [uncultured Winogradskyella sp.]
MKYWSDIQIKLKDQVYLGKLMLLLMLLAYLFILGENQIFWKIPVISVGLITWLLFRNKTKHPIVWIMVFLLLLIDLFYSYYWVANHHFMLIFMVLSVILYSYHNQQRIFIKNIQILAVIVVLASVVHKVSSSQFINGDFYYHALNLGALFKYFFRFFPDSVELANSNTESLKLLHGTDPNLGESIILKNVFPKLRVISVMLVWLTIIVEFIVAMAILLKPKNKWTHLIFIAMIIGVLCTRLETGFMSLLAISGLILCSNRKLSMLYILIILGCIALIITKIGYH